MMLGPRYCSLERGIWQPDLRSLTLTSHRLGLTGRPDRLIGEGGMVIPEEWKSSRSVWPNHRAQLGVYFLLIEDQLSPNMEGCAVPA
jgi:hypothetical protein